MKRNIFTIALATGLESDATGVDISKVTEVATLQPKPGFKEDGSLAEPSTDDVKPDAAFGEDALIAEHDEIDTVAESQEHTLALEHLQSVAMRFCRMGAALEDLVEQAEASLAPAAVSPAEGDVAPAVGGDGLTPETVQMLTTAIDGAGIGEPLQSQVALESFGFDQRVATEGFIEVIKDRAEKVWTAVAKFFRKALDLTVEKLKRAADYFRGLYTVYEKLEKENGFLISNAGKPFQSAKFEKDLHDRIWSPASTKTIIAAVDNSFSEYQAMMALADVKLSSEIRSMNNSWATDKPEQVVAAMNKVLAVAKQLADVGHSKFMHSSVTVEVNLPERITLDNTGALEGTRVVFESGRRDFSAGIRTASPADVKHLKDSARQAERAFNAVFASAWNGDLFEQKWKQRGNFDAKEDNKVQAGKLLTKYVNLLRVLSDLMAGSVWGAAEGFLDNHRAATKWVRYSVAEAKAAKRSAGEK